jgi:hypothetical protein
MQSQPPVTSRLSAPDVCTSAPLSNTLSLSSSSMRDAMIHTHKNQQAKIKVLYRILGEQSRYSKTCLKWNAIVPVFFSAFTGFRFTKGCVLIKQST